MHWFYLWLSIPAGWREMDGLLPRQQGLKEALELLLGQIKGAHRHCACHGKHFITPHVNEKSLHSLRATVTTTTNIANKC